MNAHDRDQLLAAALRARLEGWHRHELPEVIFAQARRLGVVCRSDTARRIVVEVCGGE